ncbi:helix-turn-helix domain-containing protein [Streptomyces sp. NPDC101160]|uniref:helix-turn-helix transcriptional regulator n=1 Tax=Streptomyces sp. NPDC101160 TaxID=3366118 RepID=UPI0038042951
MNFAFGAPILTQDMAGGSPPRTVLSQTDLPVTTALLAHHQGEVSGVAVRFRPIGAYRLFGVPMSHWEADDLDPSLLLPRFLATLPEQLREAESRDRPALLDSALTRLLGSARAVRPEVQWAWQELHRTRGRIRTADLASGAMWSVRQLERRFKEQVGRSPSAIARILRFSHALRLRETGMPLSKVAREAGYHDQAHFHYVFRRTTGLTPTQLPSDLLDWSSALPPATAVPDTDGAAIS